jgi:tetratricopeptide (TPR) repeat protein
LSASIGSKLRAILLATLIGSALLSVSRVVPVQVAGLRAAKHFVKPVAEAPWWSSCGRIPLSPEARDVALQAESSFYWLKAARLLEDGRPRLPVSARENSRLRDFYNGVLYECAGRHEEAVAAWRRAEAAPLFVFLGNAEQYRAWLDAVHYFRLALDIDGSLFDARVTLAETYVRLERWSDAATEYRLALNTKASATRVESGYAYSLYRAGGAGDTPVARLQDIIRRNPEERAAYRSLGEILCDKGEWPQATEWYRKAASLPDSNDELDHLEMAKCLLRSKREKDALAVLEALVARRQGRVIGEVYFFMARAHESAGDPCGARDVLRQWAHTYPDDARWASELRRLSADAACRR